VGDWSAVEDANRLFFRRRLVRHGGHFLRPESPEEVHTGDSHGR
jgi:hypothetical protein